MHIFVQPAFRTAIALAIFVSASLAHAQKLPKDFTAARQQMVDDEIIAAGIKNPRVIESMRTTPRHEFVAGPQKANAYFDMALPIGEQQTISPPFVVAYMTEAIDPQPDDTMVEIGPGRGALTRPLIQNGGWRADGRDGCSRTGRRGPDTADGAG